jgi:hypothetical protein
MCRWVLSGVREKIDAAVKAEIAAHGAIDDSGVGQVITEVVK